MTGIKYAALLLPGPDDKNPAPRLLAANMVTWHGRLSDHLDADELKLSRESIGTLEWNEVMGEQRIVLTWMPSDQPEAIDGEGEGLQKRLVIAWYGFVLAAPLNGCVGQSRYIGGAAKSITPDMKLRSISQQGDFRLVERPVYFTRDSHILGALNIWKQKGDDTWLERWIDWTQRLEAAFAAPLPILLDVALASFRTALERSHLEFCIPAFVRAAECILAVPKVPNQKVVFTERVLRIAPQLANDWYVGGANLEDRIVQLYQHRSDCVHGKVPFLQLGQQADGGEEAAARFECLAETIAREVISVAVRNPDKFPLLRDRYLLEAAWASKTFP